MLYINVYVNVILALQIAYFILPFKLYPILQLNCHKYITPKIIKKICKQLYLFIYLLNNKNLFYRNQQKMLQNKLTNRYIYIYIH